MTARLKPGDRINCKVRESKIVNPYDSDFDDERTFDIISIDDGGYYLFVPVYFNIKDSQKIDHYDARDMGLDAKFIGEEYIYITPNMIFKVHTILDGLFCAKCKNFKEYAIQNQTDGSFVCWYCTKYPPYY